MIFFLNLKYKNKVKNELVKLSHYFECQIDHRQSIVLFCHLSKEHVYDVMTYIKIVIAFDVKIVYFQRYIKDSRLWRFFG